MNNLQNITQQKILSCEQLAIEVHHRQQLGERGVFTNGCFDLLHLGHIRYLEQARHLGNFLIMGLNSDESVRKLKGLGRPLVPAQNGRKFWLRCPVLIMSQSLMSQRLVH